MRTIWIWSLLAFAGSLLGGTLNVGPDETYRRIEDACAKAGKGDEILVHPLPGNQPYEKVAVYLDKPGITIRGVPGKDGERIKLSGKDFDYSGHGRIPRAIFQFNPGADGCVLENFELFAAANKTHNGAGIRINQANQITIRNCEIHHNNMGVMSNGDLDKGGINQLLESCIIRENGDFDEPGYNHNLYLGGTSVTLRGCEVYGSLTGHNVKSRAHFNRIEYCYIHNSANRELDLVDSAETAASGSDSVLIGNIIVKDPRCKGNRAVIHFGQDGGKEHDGTLYLIHNTILSPFLSPVIDLSASKAKAQLFGNLVDAAGNNLNDQVVSQARYGAAAANITGGCNWFANGFTRGLPKGEGSTSGKYNQKLPFTDPTRGNYRLQKEVQGISGAGPELRTLKLPATPGSSTKETLLSLQYRHPAQCEKRPKAARPDIGAVQ